MCLVLEFVFFGAFWSSFCPDYLQLKPLLDLASEFVRWAVRIRVLVLFIWPRVASL